MEEKRGTRCVLAAPKDTNLKTTSAQSSSSTHTPLSRIFFCLPLLSAAGRCQERKKKTPQKAKTNAPSSILSSQANSCPLLLPSSKEIDLHFAEIGSGETTAAAADAALEVADEAATADQRAFAVVAFRNKASVVVVVVAAHNTLAAAAALSSTDSCNATVVAAAVAVHRRHNTASSRPRRRWGWSWGRARPRALLRSGRCPSLRARGDCRASRRPTAGRRTRRRPRTPACARATSWPWPRRRRTTRPPRTRSSRSEASWAT